MAGWGWGEDVGLFWPAALTAKEDFVAGGVHDSHYYRRVGARELGVLVGVYGKGKEGGGKYCDIVDSFSGDAGRPLEWWVLGILLECLVGGWANTFGTGMDGDSAGATGSAEL